MKKQTIFNILTVLCLVGLWFTDYNQSKQLEEQVQVNNHTELTKKLLLEDYILRNLPQVDKGPASIELEDLPWIEFEDSKNVM